MLAKILRTEQGANTLIALNVPGAGDARVLVREYQLALQTDPNRFNGLLGAAKAAEALGDGGLAADYYGQLLANCASASGAALTTLAHAQAALSKR